jgi:hypothetical protein
MASTASKTKKSSKALVKPQPKSKTKVAEKKQVKANGSVSKETKSQ